MFSFRDDTFLINREIRFSFQKVKGIGFWKSFFICAKLGFGYPFFFSNFKTYQFFLVCFFFRRLSIVETHISRRRQLQLENWIKVRYVHARKLIYYLPARGQRTRSNNGTRKRERLRKIQKWMAMMAALAQAEKEEKDADKKRKKEAKLLAKRIKSKTNLSLPSSPDIINKNLDSNNIK